MKTLGVVQFQQKKFKLLAQPEGSFKKHLGGVPENFITIVFGNSGNGKTEYCIQLAKYFTQYGVAAWLSYEQGHGYDLQTAINRNKMEEVSGRFLVIDPVADLPPNTSFIEDLVKYLSKRNSPDFIFIDSIDYTRFTWDDYDLLKRKFGKKKTLIFISHANGKRPKSSIGERILYDGGIGIYVRDFIATVSKNRFGGFEDHIIYEKRAREINPLYFKLKSLTPDPSPGGEGSKKGKAKPEKQAAEIEEMHEELTEA